MDIQGFFYNIKKEVLYRVIEKRVRDEAILWLARTLIFHDCTKDVVFKGKKTLIKEVPAHKTLFNTQNRRGLPIGNLTSQFFANVYLDVLDQFVKHHLKEKLAAYQDRLISEKGRCTVYRYDTKELTDLMATWAS